MQIPALLERQIMMKALAETDDEPIERGAPCGANPALLRRQLIRNIDLVPNEYGTNTLQAVTSNQLTSLVVFRVMPIPQEIQDNIIDKLAGDIDTLFRTCLVNKAWRLRTYVHLHTRIVVRAIACKSYAIIVNEDGSISNEELTSKTNPSRDFYQCLDDVPNSFDPHITHLTLSAASGSQRLEHALRGIQFIKPILEACTIRTCLLRYPKLVSLTIEDVEWADCLESSVHCTCMEDGPKRVYETIALRRISHRSVYSYITFVTRSASAIKHLIMEDISFNREECLAPRYAAVPTECLTFSFIDHPWEQNIPNFAPSTLRSLEFRAMSWHDQDLIEAMIRKQKLTLEHIALKVWWFGDGMWRLCLDLQRI
ncbi:hypothetical protein EIP86_000257 [Pleurotus ostreatoroseus]|nr:hypothetical protein EIP86_000257 [Pleurotus ostreatoroseus]